MSEPVSEAQLDPAPLTDGAGRRFERLALLGKGGFGEVYLCRVERPGGLVQHVAVKLLHEGLDPRSQAVERLRDEARTLASLRHPVLLAALDLVELSGRVALVTEFIEGQDLSALLQADSPDRIPLGPLLEVVAAVAGALDAAWQQLRVVHRDVKPANVRVGVHGQVKLLDFGIAHSALQDRAARTESAMLVGTVRYLAPERFEVDQAPEPASDVFALGCVLYDGLTGEPLFGQRSLSEMCRLALVPEDWARFVDQRLAAVRADVGVVALLHGLLAHAPADRPTAAAVVQQCEDLVAAMPGPRLARWCRERRWPRLALVPQPPTAATRTLPAERSAASTHWEPGALSPSPTPHSSTSLLAPLPAPEPARPAPRRSWFGWVAAGATAVAATAIVAGIGVLSVGVVLVGVGRDQPDAPLPPIDDFPEPPAVREPAPVPAEPKPAAPVDVRPQPAPRPRRSAPEVAPEVAPEPAPEPPPPAVTYTVALTSIPGGVEVHRVDTGERLGLTPLELSLPAGPVRVRMVAPDGAALEPTLQVGKNTPRRYVWRIAEGRLDAGY